MSVHHALRTLVSRYGPGIIESGDLRATLDDFLEEGQATPGQINLLADAVRLGAFEQMVPMLSQGADPQTVVEAVGARLAANRGGDQRSASWACAALGFGVGQVPEELVLSYATGQPVQDGPQGGAASSPPEPDQWRTAHTRVVEQPMQPPQPHAQYGPPPPSEPSRSRAFSIALIAAGVVLAMVVAGVWIAFRNESTPGANPSTTTSTDEARPTETPDASPATEATTSSEQPDETVNTPTDNGLPNVSAPFVNQQCDSQIIVVLASSGNPAEYQSTIAAAVGTVPDAKYLRTDQSCSSFNQEIDGNPIYAAYIGPLASVEEACAERYASGVVGSYVRTLDADRETQDICTCQDSADELPFLQATASASYDHQQRVADVQTLLIYAGYDLGEYASGDFDADLVEVVRDFQRDNGLAVDGRIGSETWSALLAAGCP